MTSFLPVPCPPIANDPASTKKPAEANATTREADQPGSTIRKGAFKGKISDAICNFSNFVRAAKFCQVKIRK